MKVYLGVNVRDEKHLREWVIHHLNIGFDKIYITDHKSKNPVDKYLEPIKEYLYLFREDNEMEHLKQKCMRKFFKFCKSQNVDWMIYLDADEFIVLNDNYKNIKEYIESIPDEVPSIGIPWLMFGSNFLVKDPDDLIISSYTKCMPFFFNHTKGLTRIKYIEEEEPSFQSPHFFINTLGLYYNIYFKKLRSGIFHDEARDIKSDKVSEMPIFIAHYVNQSRETLIKRKYLLPRDDSGLFRKLPIGKIVENDLDNLINSNDKALLETFNNYNNVEILYVKNKYSKDIRDKLSNYNWKF